MSIAIKVYGINQCCELNKIQAITYTSTPFKQKPQLFHIRPSLQDKTSGNCCSSYF